MGYQVEMEHNYTLKCNEKEINSKFSFYTKQQQWTFYTNIKM